MGRISVASLYQKLVDELIVNHYPNPIETEFTNIQLEKLESNINQLLLNAL